MLSCVNKRELGLAVFLFNQSDPILIPQASRFEEDLRDLILGKETEESEGLEVRNVRNHEPGKEVEFRVVGS